MKLKDIIIVILLFAGNTLMAQNTFPTSGNVGIGTLNPTVWFGGTVQQIEGRRAVLRLAPSLSGDIGTILFKGAYSDGVNGSDDEFHLNYLSDPVNPLINIGAYKNGAKTVLTLMGTGNVGIGTATPSERLVINGNFKVILDQANFPDKNVMGIVSLGYSGITGAKNWALRGVYQYPFGVGNNADGGDLDVLKSMNGAIVLATKTDGTPLGNVGIGITNPAERLAVNGVIRAKEIKVEAANWPDYVFETAYELPSLTEVEKNIKANGHLPGIPSAQTLTKQGIAVSEMLSLQQKKIEELTLYIIELKKELDAIKSKIK
ncbi:hypothetical protein QF042_001869 [Pedobacter sp. W3I1]|uniref:hypothetical protein n=1 Tax=Pedobacter sp. W3I1 TaxID=3042291 RepID=UPI00277F411C|nr:hypothetical protein [Pedobacter sp. W3I1]MDQ0638304.1 hypothetical protein [Pedobacter sp. W3I1]